MEDQAELDAHGLAAKIDELEQRVMRLRLPGAYDSSLYTMRVHIGLLRSHLESARDSMRSERNEPTPSRQESNSSHVSGADGRGRNAVQRAAYDGRGA